MRKTRGFILCSLFFIFKGGNAFAQGCGVGNSYACFKYSNAPLLEQTPHQDWISFKKNENIFTSLENFEGQYLPKNNNDYLRILNLNTTLFLKNLSDNKAIAITQTKEGLENIFSLLSKNSTLIGNIEITKRSGERNFGNKLVALEFDGGKKVESTLLEKYEKDISYSHRRRPSTIIESKYNNDQIWAFIGDITNSSQKKVVVDFKNGAKMIGDFYAYDSEIGITFHHYPELLSSTISLPVVFEGGLYNRGGEIDLNVESGGIRACSVNGEDFGILAENGGINTIQLTDTGTIQNSQYLYASQILAQTNIPHIAKTQNTVTFRNAKTDEQNFVSLYDIVADSGKNILQSMDTTDGGNTELNVFVERSILSTSNPKAKHYSSQEIGNVIHIDGQLKVGEYAMKTLESNEEIFGIMALAGSNAIKLKDTLKEADPYSGIVEIEKKESSGYYEDKTLLTPRIFASAYKQGVGENYIEIDGDLKLMYLQMEGGDGRGVIGAEIIATEGGSNTIIVNGAIDVVSYRTRLDDTIGAFVNEEVKRDEKDLLKTLIATYGTKAPSKNTLLIRNTDLGGVFNGAGFRDLILGDVVAYGGSNEITLYAPFCEDWKGVEIKSLIAGSMDARGRKHIGGSNHIEIINGMEVTIKKILTQAGGKNHLWVMQDGEMSDINQISDLAITYGEGGETMLHFGIEADEHSSKSGIEINLDSWGGRKYLNLNVGKGRDGGLESYGFTIVGSFYGQLCYLKEAYDRDNLGEIDYAIEDRSIFVGRITDDTRVEQSITIGDGAKFVPTNEGTVSFETLVIDSSTIREMHLLRNTVDMQTSVIDLATSGRSFTNISSKYSNRALNLKSFVIHRDGRHNPLLRLYASSPSQVDHILTNDVTAKDVGLDTQILLPTELIGYDFSDDNAVIFATQNGGETLELTSTTAQTGFITYTTDIIKESHPYTTDPHRYSHTWRLGKSKDVIIDPDFIKFAGILLAHNYGLFQVHFNSLSKRMGELRGDKNANGVWGRIFGGELINSYGYEKIDSGYFVAQGGYDRSFGVSGGDDYAGVAFSYGIMDSTSRPFMGSYLFNTPFAYEAFSHSVEIGAYNVYLHESGFYSDTIAKVGYLTSRFSGVNDNSVGAEISNYTFTLGQELGYQIKLGKSDEWFITPSFEMILGYLSPSSAKQKYDGQTLHSTLKGVVTLRNRLGGEVGYTLIGSKASLDFKIGANYVFDYADASASYSVLGAPYIKSIVEPSFISPSHQMVLNAGINVRLDNDIKLYFDAETSFFGKIRTKYQVNAGIRYSFGERVHRLTPEERAKQIFIKLIAE